MGDSKRRRQGSTTITVAGATGVDVGDTIRITSGDGRTSTHKVRSITETTITIGRTWLDKLILWTAIVVGSAIATAAAWWIWGK